MLSSATAPPGAARHHRNRGSSSSKKKYNRVTVLAAAAFCFVSFSLLPILVLEHLSRSYYSQQKKGASNAGGSTVSVHNLMGVAKEVHKSPILPILQARNSSHVRTGSGRIPPAGDQADHPDHPDHPEQQRALPPDEEKKKSTLDRDVPKISLSDLKGDEGWRESHPLARGVAGRSMEETPALKGAQRAHIECEVNVDSLAYWNDPQGDRDRDFVSPFDYRKGSGGGDDDDTKEKYISFTPDRGGWNNVRMSMEIIFVIAAATGRTLVLPPKEPLYLLNKAKKGEEKHRGFADFFPIHTAEFQKRVKTISMVEFLEKEGGKGGIAEIPDEKKDAVLGAADHCDHRKASTASCVPIFDFFDTVGNIANVSSSNTCLVFDKDKFEGDPVPEQTMEYIKQVCSPIGDGPKHSNLRKLVFWDSAFADSPLVHFKAADKDLRLLTHFYAMIHFTDPAVDNYFKRFVRDFLHYHDNIFCAAGKIIKAVQAEGAARGFPIDPETGAGGYSSMHVRRGELQYKKVKIPAQEWYDNTKEVWQPNEILYIATDERKKEFFDDITAHHDLRFLDDYWDFAGLGELDGNYMGMIDTIVASRGRAFAGTWFSTFSGYINRMRGYHGMSMMDSWYSFLDRKDAVHVWKTVEGAPFAYEWPDGWIGIDADVWPSRDKF